MSEIIPPLISDTPPPPPCLDDDDDDEFGNFIGSNDLSYGCENYSLPTTPEHSPKIVSIPNQLDINSNTDCPLPIDDCLPLDISKDHYDRRKSASGDIEDFRTSPNESVEVYPVLNFSEKCSNPNLINENVESTDLEIPPEILESVSEIIVKEMSEIDINCEVKRDCIEKEGGHIEKNQETLKNDVVNNELEGVVGKLKTVQKLTENHLKELHNGFETKDINSFNAEENKPINNIDMTSSKLHELLNKETNKTVNDSTYIEDFSQLDTIPYIDTEVEINQSSYFKESDKKEEKTFQKTVCKEFQIDENKKIEITKYFETNKVAVREETSPQVVEETILQVVEETIPQVVEETIPQVTEETILQVEETLHQIEEKNIPQVGKENIPQVEETLHQVEEKNISQVEERSIPQAEESRENNFSSTDNEDNFADFSDFHSFNENIENPINFPDIPNLEKQSQNTTEDDDDFGNFVSTTTSSTIKLQESNALTDNLDDDDDFGDFQNISSIPSENLPVPSNPLEKAQQVFEESFPKIENEDLSDYIFEEIEKDSHIFDLLKDVTDTPGLTYQWAKSSSQKLLLKALNIDERNILPPWNPSMPIFAANLSLQPLEPIKTEVVMPQQPPVSPSNLSKFMTAEIPSAQFDWKGSGLENPLESSQTMLLSLDQLTISLDIPTNESNCNSQNSPCSFKDLDDWSVWVKSVSQDVATPVRERPLEIDISQVIEKSDSILDKNIPSKSELETKLSAPIDLSIFSSDSRQMDPIWSKTTNLRETHISNKNTDDLPDNVWMNPLGEFSLPQTYISGSSEAASKEETKDIVEDDFDDFQAAPIEQPSNWAKEVVHPCINITSTAKEKESSNTVEINNFIPITNVKDLDTIQAPNKHEKTNEDDEFTDFQSSIPISAPQSKSIVPERSALQINPILPSISPALSMEPLKPTPIYQKPIDPTPSQINWPDPGVTEDEIKKFEEIFSSPTLEKSPQVEKKELSHRKQDKSEIWSDFEFVKTGVKQPDKVISSVSSDVIKPPRNDHNLQKVNSSSKKNTLNEVWSDFVKPVTETNIQKSKVHNHVKHKSAEEDEWSDFVSAQKPSPVHKVAARETERTSSPDLTLSVFNLGSIQPAKQPIPVITAQGLVQTKLSANTTNTSPKVQQKNTKHLFQPIQNIPAMTPSIISNQYVSQAYNINPVTTSQHSTSNQVQSHPDDEWGEFVSSPLPSMQQVNGYRQQTHWQSSSQSTPWIRASPNIITNPRHYIPNTSDMNKKVSSVTTTKKNMVPNLVLPELEFVAPKNRISANKKK